RDAEVRATRRVDPPDSGPPLRHVQVELQNPVFGQGELESQGGDRLLRLADRTARGREVQILGELLGDGARAAYPVAMPHRCREAGPESAGVVHAQGIRN